MDKHDPILACAEENTDNVTPLPVDPAEDKILLDYLPLREKDIPTSGVDFDLAAPYQRPDYGDFADAFEDWLVDDWSDGDANALPKFRASRWAVERLQEVTKQQGKEKILLGFRYTYLSSGIIPRAKLMDASDERASLLVQVFPRHRKGEQPSSHGIWRIIEKAETTDRNKLAAIISDWDVDFAVDNPTARGDLMSYIHRTKVKSVVRSTARTGWVGPSSDWAGERFALPTESHPLKAPMVVLHPDGNQEADPAIAASGTLEGWRESVAVRALGQTRAVFALSIALAAPLIKHLGIEGGGVHWLGSSSTGKTTLLALAASVWGRPAKGDFIKTWNTTRNGIEAIAELHNDLILPLDEIQEMDARAVGETVYMLGNGQGRARMKSNTKARPSKRWRTLVISSGEVSLEEHARSADKRTRAGQQVRLADLPADAGEGLGVWTQPDGHPPKSTAWAREQSDALRAAAREHYGTAGPAFLDRLLGDKPEHLAGTIEAIREHQRCLASQIVPAGGAGQVARVGEFFALIGTAGAYAAKWGILPFGRSAAQDAALEMFKAWIEERGGIGESEDKQCLDAIRHTIELKGATHFDLIDLKNTLVEAPENRVRFERLGFRRERSGRSEYLFFSSGLKAVAAEHGVSPKRIKAVLADRDVLLDNSGAPLSCPLSENPNNRVTIAGLSRARYTIVSESVLDLP